MQEYLCIYNNEFVGYYIRRVKAVSKGSATVKFNAWLECDGCFPVENDIITICIDDIKNIESINYVKIY